MGWNHGVAEEAEDCTAPVARARLRSFHELMQYRVQRILLVSSLYQSFIMSEEGQLHETLLSQFVDLNLSQVPDLVQVASAEEALRLLTEEGGFDLVIASVDTGDSDAAQLARALHEAGVDIPLIALAYTGRELVDFTSKHENSHVERTFLWQGDVRIFLAMVKYLEDRENAHNDTIVKGVPVILVVEDNPRYFSSFLPSIYAELYRHTHRLLSEDPNLSQKMMRMRARPKVLLCTTFEEAWDAFEHYGEHVLGVVSDFEFPRGGELVKRAGLELCERVRETRPNVRLVMQSSVPGNREPAEEIGASFLLKGSPALLSQLREVLSERFGFGDFIFRRPDGHEIDRAANVEELGRKLRKVPPETVAYHAERNHFSNWLKARTEFQLAERVRPTTVAGFGGVENLREHLASLIEASRRERRHTVISDFDRKTFDPRVSITRIGSGSLGGKARGVAFANRLLFDCGIRDEYPDVELGVPPSVVMGTHVFEEFLEGPHREFAAAANPDREIVKFFLQAPFPRSAVAGLRAFLQRVKYPLAVRSSSLLEDSLSQPFAGVYSTYMLPNSDPDVDTRWNQLSMAIKRVYASAFAERAKSYLAMTSFRLEEEKMAVMIQELVGRRHPDRFYPDYSGVARSYNFYPEPGQGAEDGVVAVALGLGQTVVGGAPCLRFCPKYPRHIVGFSSVKSALDTTQRDFYALDVSRRTAEAGLAELRKYSLEVAEDDGMLTYVGSTYVPEDDRIVDGTSRPGPRLITFAQVLKHGAFPLPEILSKLLDRCEQATGAPVEIEFAGNLPMNGQPGRFAFLQLRPLALSKEQSAVEIGEVREEDVVCRASRVLGNGLVDDIADLVVVDVERFDRLRSHEVAREVARFDAVLRREGLPYLLVGVGRWGSSDPSLGIPVGWNQICGARVIIEAGFQDITVAPSQGTHFFQNLTSSNVGYFTVNPDAGEGTLDWEWLTSVEAAEETEFVRRIRLPEPLVVKMSGKSGEGVVLRPGAA
jgi:CheY-like chemotaxis protein